MKLFVLSITFCLFGVSSCLSYASPSAPVIEIMDNFLFENEIEKIEGAFDNIIDKRKQQKQNNNLRCSNDDCGVKTNVGRSKISIREESIQ